MPRILINALSLYLFGILTDAYGWIFNYMTDLRLKNSRSLSDKRIISMSAKYYCMKRSFEEREKFVMAILFQYRGV